MKEKGKICRGLPLISGTPHNKGRDGERSSSGSKGGRVQARWVEETL